jgi:hypothetical protein
VGDVVEYVDLEQAEQQSAGGVEEADSTRHGESQQADEQVDDTEDGGEQTIG